MLLCTEMVYFSFFQKSVTLLSGLNWPCREIEHKTEDLWCTNNKYGLKTFYKRHNGWQKIPLEKVMGFEMWNVTLLSLRGTPKEVIGILLKLPIKQLENF